MTSSRYVCIVCTVFLLSACTLVSKHGSPQSGPPSGDSVGAGEPETRDVPYAARSDRDGALRKRVMVLPFLDADPARSGQAAKIARDSLIRGLNRSEVFVVVGASDFPKNVSQFVKDGQYDLVQMAKISDSIGVAALVEGKVIEIKAKRVGDEVGLVRKIRVHMQATIQLRMISSKSGQILLDEMRTAELEDTTTRYAERSFSDRFLEDDPELIEAVVAKAFVLSIPKITKAVEKLSWEGRVALIKGEKIYLNAGRLSGLQIGDILKVMEEGEDVYDPETGALVGRVPGRLKGTLEVVSYFGKDGAVSVIHSGSGFKENDIVELY